MDKKKIDKEEQEELEEALAEKNINEAERLLKEENNGRENLNKTNSKGIIICILILAIIIACYFIFYKDNKEETKDKNNKTKETEVKKPDLKSEYRLSGNGLENFDLYFLQLENEEKNKVYSPLSIKYALEMLAEGTDGNSKEELDAIIGDYVAKKYTNSKNMSFANALFIKDSYEKNIKNTYKELLENKYGAEVLLDSFKKPDKVNKWVSDKTFNLIPELIDDASDKDFILINALAIDMEWVKKIQSEHEDYIVDLLHEQYKEEDYDSYGVYLSALDSSDYSPLEFEGYNKKAKSAQISAVANKYDTVNTVGENKIRETITKEYSEWINSAEGKECMEYSEPDEYPKDVNKYVDKFIKDLDSNYKHISSSTDFYFYDDEEVKAFSKDLKEYDGTTLQYVGIMPKKESLKDYISKTNANNINTLINKMKDISLNSFEDGYMSIINGYIPMFKFEYELELMTNLQKLGIKDVFDSEKANLSKMVEGNAYIDTALHKANIEFSNDGIKASAATAIGGKGSTSCGFEHRYEIPVKKIDLTFNKPYMYFVRDKQSGEVWFAGTVYEPIEFNSSEYPHY